MIFFFFLIRIYILYIAYSGTFRKSVVLFHFQRQCAQHRTFSNGCETTASSLVHAKTSYPIKRSPFEPPSLLSKRERLISSKRNAKSISKRWKRTVKRLSLDGASLVQKKRQVCYSLCDPRRNVSFSSGFPPVFLRSP